MQLNSEDSRSRLHLRRVTALVGVSVLLMGCAPNVAVESGTAAMKQLQKAASENVEASTAPQEIELPQSSTLRTASDDTPDQTTELREASTSPSTFSQTSLVDQSTQSSATPSLLRSVIAVCPESFRAALAPWVERRKREGLEVHLIPSETTSKALKKSLVETASDRCSYILLVGDSSYSPNDEPLDASVLVPTVYRLAEATAKYQQSPQLPGDFAYGDFDDDGFADASVGRLPVKSSAQLTSIIQRIIAYEDSTNFGDWRSRVDLVAGIGGFGAMIDGAIEMVAGGIITGSLPGFVRTRITHASPTSDFHPGADEFTSTVLNNYRDGARFWVYAGHGWVDELDRVPANQFGRPVLSTSDVPELKCEHNSSPIALMLACYTGAFDANDDCLAERMLLADQGPIAVLAGSRVTMPYGNASAAVGLIHAVYDRKARRLGDAWRDALIEMATTTQDDPELRTRRTMIDGIASLMGGGSMIDVERREHMQLYNWFGDPTLRLGSEDEIQLLSPGDLHSGNPLVIRGRSPIAGRLTVEVHRRLGSALSSEIGKTNDSRVKYFAANETMLCRSEQETRSGEWTCTLSLAESDEAKHTATTPVIIRASVVSDSAIATGSQTAWLRPASKVTSAKPNSASATAVPVEND